MIMGDGPAGLRGAVPVNRPWIIGVLIGAAIGWLAALVALAGRPVLVPVAILVVLSSTLVAGRIAPLGPALAHGACAWAVIFASATVTRRPAETWYGIPAIWLLLVLVEDMALIGRAGRVRRIDE